MVIHPSINQTQYTVTSLIGTTKPNCHITCDIPINYSGACMLHWHMVSKPDTANWQIACIKHTFHKDYITYQLIKLIILLPSGGHI